MMSDEFMELVEEVPLGDAKVERLVRD